MTAALTLALALIGAAEAADPLPAYLGDARGWPQELRSEIEDIWTRRTVSRTVTGTPAQVSLDLYQLFVDLPEVTAAAAQHLGDGGYRVIRRGPDHFDVADSEGAHGTYRVIVKRPGERILIAHVQRRARLLGDVRGAMITRLTFREEREGNGPPVVSQRVETVVRIDHRVAALIARILVPLFPDYADRKISEAFTIAAQVAAWSVGDPGAFCRWLASQPDGERHRETFAPRLPACARPGAAARARMLSSVPRIIDNRRA